jgi:hydroxymethylglutaryl-CoA lyase
MGAAVNNLPANARIVEVGPRDGLQNQPKILSTDQKLEFIRLLADAGLKDIEVSSFVHPKWIPQLADADELVPQLPPISGVRYSALVPNVKGLERALKAGVTRVAVFTAASETFNKRNINMSIAESLEAIAAVAERATREGVSVRGYISTCFVCPYEGKVAKQKVVDVARQLFSLGLDELSIGDTVGAATPVDVEDTVSTLIESFGASKLAMHFHDTYGMAIANVFASLRLGIAVFDSSAGGIGGCPYAPGATGNVATEKLHYLFERLGIEDGLSLGRLNQAIQYVNHQLRTA